VTDPRMLDLRSKQTAENVADCCAMAHGVAVRRDPKDVYAAMLHQTGCWFSVDKWRLKRHGGDELAARHERGMEVNAHLTAMRHGRCVIAHDPELYVNHGHNANSWSAGLEHEGLYDADGNPVGLPKGVDIGEIIEAGRAGLTWLAETLPNLRLVWAHRQSMRRPGRAKTADPGRRIFREVGIEHGVKKLGLTIEPERVFGVGKPLALNWYA
jgi:hypothetical protein